MDDWAQISDIEERRRIQNRLAQRKRRNKLRDNEELSCSLSAPQLDARGSPSANGRNKINSRRCSTKNRQSSVPATQAGRDTETVTANAVHTASGAQDTSACHNAMDNLNLDYGMAPLLDGVFDSMGRPIDSSFQPMPTFDSSDAMFRGCFSMEPLPIVRSQETNIVGSLPSSSGLSGGSISGSSLYLNESLDSRSLERAISSSNAHSQAGSPWWNRDQAGWQHNRSGESIETRISGTTAVEKLDQKIDAVISSLKKLYDSGVYLEMLREDPRIHADLDDLRHRLRRLIESGGPRDCTAYYT